MRRAHPTGTPRRGMAGVWVLAGALGVASVKAGTVARLSVGVLGMAIFLVVALSGRRFAVSLMLVFLVLLGFLRRLLIPFVGWSSHDPLLLVSPAAAAVLLMVSSRQERPPPRTAMGSIAAVLAALAVAEVFNPNEASITLAAQSLLFYLTPLLWFFVGARLDPAERDRVLDVVFWMVLPVLALGFYHTFVGLLPFEYHWLGVSHQSPAIFITGFKVRPFSTFSSPQEYGYFLAFCIVIIVARLLHHPRHPVWLGILGFTTFIALFLQASRTVFVFLLAALFVMAVVRLRSLVVVLLTLSAIGLGGLLGLRTETGQAPSVSTAVGLPAASSPDLAAAEAALGVSPASASASRVSKVHALFSHELAGLTHPTRGTGPLHVTLILDGLEEGLHHPLGLGASHGTIASIHVQGADQLLQALVASAENDVGNTFAATGLLGGLALIAFIILGTFGSLRLYRRDPTARHLVWVGLCIVAQTEWLTGALYATSTVLFLCLGALSRELAELGPSRPGQETPAVQGAVEPVPA